MIKEKNRACYELLSSVMLKGAYSSIQLTDALPDVADVDRAYVTRLFYGVLEKSVKYDYYLEKLCVKKPQAAVGLLIKIGLYLCEYMAVPDYAAVDNIVSLSHSLGKGGASGFINAVLRGYKNVVLPTPGSPLYLSITHSFPLWLTKLVIADYGYAFTRAFLEAELSKEIHIRVNTTKLSKQAFEKRYPFVTDKTTYGYYAQSKTVKSLRKSDFIVQSLSSIIAANKYLEYYSGGEILDLCAAPGGKAVLLSEQTNAKVTACDIHPHRVDLIKGYAKKAGRTLDVFQNDATVYSPSLNDRFKLVVCDVPCSGVGVYKARPDILLNRKPQDIGQLCELQLNILTMAAKYVCSGGVLCYSTCTILKQENQQVVQSFLKNNQFFELVSEQNLFPQADNCDGFYIAIIKKMQAEV